MQSETLAGEWQAEGRVAARVPLILRPREGSSLSFIRRQRHFLLLSRSCLRPEQQSTVGVLASPPTYGRHVARATNWSAHSALSWFTSQRANPINISTKMDANGTRVICFEAICGGREKEREFEKMGMLRGGPIIAVYKVLFGLCIFLLRKWARILEFNLVHMV